MPSLAARMCPELATPSTLSSTSSSAQTRESQSWCNISYYHFFVFVSLRSFHVISFGLQLANELTQRSPVPNIRPCWLPKPLKWQCAVQVLPTPTWAQSWRKRCSWRRPCLRKKQTCSCAGHIPRQICYQASVQRPYAYDSQRARVQRWQQFLLGNCLDSFVFAYLFMHCFNFPWLPNAVAPSNCRLRSDSSACCSKALTFHHGPLMIPGTPRSSCVFLHGVNHFSISIISIISNRQNEYCLISVNSSTSASTNRTSLACVLSTLVSMCF